MAANKIQRGSSGCLPEEMIREILLRLPPRHLLRCRTICKAWRRLATDDAFILDHHARQPAQPLLTVYPFVAPHINCLEAVDLRTNKRRMVARFVERAPRPFSNDAATNIAYNIYGAVVVHASCDGLLLLSFHETFFVCNPATRQGALLPLFRDGRGIAGFYRHAASAEYRVLYHQLRYRRVEGLHRKYYVFTLGSQQARNIELGTSSTAVGEGLAKGLAVSSKWPPVLLHGSLHWPPQQSQEGNILVFDTAAESFRWIAPPPTAVIQDENNDTRLSEMEGTLAMFYWEQDARISDLWFLEDYEEANWVCKHRVELPVKLVYEPLPFYPAIPYREGDMLVPEGSDTVLHYDKAGKLQGSFDSFVMGLRITPHMLKESLVLHEFLHTQKNGGASEWFSEVEFADGLPVTELPF
uniref:Uncharacterized protein n=2 Tax=Avena sativa TaxID=4498 RepID=A0ACD5XF18_AVESA